MMVIHQIKVLQAVVSAIAEGGRGVSGTAFPQQPAKALKLYEFEGSPFCRRVREVITLLNLDVEIYPCPKGGTKYRSVVKEKGGKLQFPFLIDENTGDQLYESQDIIHHLFKHYGKTGKTPQKFSSYPNMPYVAVAGTILNGARGIWINKKIVDRAAPEQKLELWSFEASPYSRIVRSLLSELELPYILHNVAKERWQDMGPAILRLKPGKYIPLEGGKREKLLPIMQDKMQVPYLVDPNTGVKMFESAQIVKYLKKQYGR
ncbi:MULTISPECIES: glutathione S-transferase N-terminal domain-containing protein [Acinetobacter]|jgi:glutathione S-transferase|uniref:glutathione S-transferase N-terminal domain-containing protein n=1 Tax=Acinetobacter TaxID=469 RepID=UPI0009B71DB6|nr:MULTISPECIES: glutathione S-transferase N-terminal domain-containing protein [Acinetobacter]MBN6515592.1 glutathione S-transferase N-terminal domain-containing protein [Acinetobacter pittii]MCG9502555.1 glutathione S-transferase N-terminal domain-containing protein [Acinetobacter pittii]MCH2017787.1 glutathione S-transferase N-terminal domain-containing protein [Acinetobacter pittii]MCU4470567.1 glutathione S-transferase N-terminal domain-containing protein [Acinetobacter pittii]MCU4485294.